MIELLVTISVIAVLAGLALPVLGAARGKARNVREVQAARNAVSGWLSYSRDNDGSILAGFKLDPQARNAAGKLVTYPVNARYPFRLAPYLEYQLKGSLLVNAQSRLRDDYSISGFPSFGLNVTFVGGDFTGSSDLQPTSGALSSYGQFVASKLPQLHSPSRMLVLASARFTDPTSGEIEGYHYVRSPNLWARRWPAKYERGANAAYYEHVDFRFNDRAICAMADGHVEALDFNQLGDMRRWSNQAAEADDPDWVMKPL